jgi:hypothetical protein
MSKINGRDLNTFFTGIPGRIAYKVSGSFAYVTTSVASTVAWGDGSFSTLSANIAAYKLYATSGTYTVTITPNSGSSLGIISINHSSNPTTVSYVNTNFPNIPSALQPTVAGAASAVGAIEGVSGDTIIDTLALCNYWASYEAGACFTDTGGTTQAVNGNSVARVNTFKGANNLLQSTAGSRPTFADSATSLSFDGTDDRLTIAELTTGNNNFHHFYTCRPASASVRGSAMKVGTTGAGGTGDGWALGIGNTTMDNTGNNLLALLEDINWQVTTTSFGTNFSILEYRRISGATTLSVNNINNVPSNPSGTLKTPTGATTFVGGYTAADSSNRHLNHTSKGWINFNIGTLTTTQIRYIRRFLNQYYSLGISL